MMFPPQDPDDTVVQMEKADSLPKPKELKRKNELVSTSLDERDFKN